MSSRALLDVVMGGPSGLRVREGEVHLTQVKFRVRSEGSVGFARRRGGRGLF